MKIQDFKDMERAEFTEFVKNNHETMFEKLGLESFLSVCISKKYFTPDLDSKYVTSVSDQILLLQIMIDQKFTPSLNQFQRCFEALDDKVISNYIRSWPSLPYTNEDLFSLVNSKKQMSARTLIDISPKLLNDEVLLNIASLSSVEDLVIEKLKGDNKETFAAALLAKYFEKRSRWSEIYCSKLSKDINTLVHDLTQTKGNLNYYFKESKNVDFLEFSKVSHLYEKEYNGSTFIEYNETIELLSIETIFNIRLDNIVSLEAVPNDSVLSILKFNIFTGKEISAINGTQNSDLIFFLVKKALRKASLEEIKAISKEKLLTSISKMKTATFISHIKENSQCSEIANWLKPQLETKFKAAISKNIVITPVKEEDGSPKKVGGRKKSYYNEILNALREGNTDAIRQFVASGYTLEKFASDSFQSSKNNNHFRSYKIDNLTKEEILTLLKANENIRRAIIYSLNNKNKSIKWDKADFIECSSLLNMNDELMLQQCSDDAIKLAIDEKPDRFIGYEFKSLSKDLLKYSVKKLVEAGDLSDQSNVFDPEKTELKALFDRETLKKIAEAQITKYEAKECILYTDNNGEYLIEDKDIYKPFEHVSKWSLTTYLTNLKNRSPKHYEEFARAYIESPKKLKELTGANDARRDSDITLMFISEFTPDNSKKELNKKLLKKIRSQSAFTLNELDALVEFVNSDDWNIEETIRLSDVKHLKLLSQKLNKRAKIIAGIINRGWNNKSDKILIPGDLLKLDISGIIILSKFVTLEGIRPLIDNGLTVGLQDNEEIVTLLNFGDLLGTEESVVSRLSEIDMKSFAAFITEKGLKTLRSIISLVKFKDSKKEIEFYRSLIEGTREEKLITNLFDLGLVLKKTEKRIGPLIAKDLSEKDGKELDQVFECIFTVERHGPSFGALSVKGLSNESKIELVKIIESIDDRYKSLNLTKKNLVDVDYLYEFSTMSEVIAKEAMDLARVINLPNGLDKNPKLKTGINNALALIGYPVLKKVRAVSQILKGEKLDLSDVFDYSDQAQVKESEGFKKISSESINALLEADSSAMSILFKTVDKSTILRFLRSASEVETSFLTDAIKMTVAVKRGAEHLADTAYNNTLTEDEKIEAMNLRDSIIQRLDEVASMDTVKHMHDRLVSLSSFLTTDGNVPTGQAKYKNISAAKSFKDSFDGYTLFFPKNRGEVNALGNTHGWCVSHQSSYFDGVVRDGNILVAICNNESPSVASAIALAHFRRGKDGEFHLDQIRHSKLVGNPYDDASGKFRWNEILAAVKKVDASLIDKGLAAA